MKSCSAGHLHVRPHSHVMLRFLRLFPKVALVASVGLFAACLLNDGYYIEGSNPRAWSPAWGLLLIGWIGIGSGTLAWLANPALLLAWVLSLTKKHAFSLVAAMAALLLMVSFLFQTSVISSEAPIYSRIVGYGVGFWLWVGSAVQAVGSAIAAMPTEFMASGLPSRERASASRTLPLMPNARQLQLDMSIAVHTMYV